VGVQRAAAPVLSGSVPPLAASFHPRPETGLGLADALRPGHTIVLVPGQGGDPSAPSALSAPSGGMSAAGAVRGTGKTQLAIEFAHAMWNARAVDLLVWVPAGNRTDILASYALAMTELDAQQAGETADAAANRFLGWLSRTNRRWAVVLDGVTSASDLDGLWPGGASGQLVVTTRLSGSELGGDDRTVYQVPGFSRREALAYLNSRLTGYPDQRIEALDLAEDLDGLPIAMAQAAAVVAESEITCRDYRVAYAERLRNTASTLVDGCPQSMLATWSLAVEQAHELSPAGLAWPALAFAAVLDTSGIPAGVLISPAACGYITGRPSAATGGDQNLVRAAFGNLERLGLLSVDKTSAARTVWLHPAVRAAVRAYLPPGSVEQVVAAAATALLEAWPETGSPAGEPQLNQALRDCVASLSAYGGDLLWKPEAHSLLLRAGESLAEDQLVDPAVAYWQAIAATCGHLLGPGHAQSVLARGRLAAAYSSAGRLAEAVFVFEMALTDRERELGQDHPDTVLARVNLARSYEAAGREAEAIMLYEQTLADSERLLGPAHRDTLTVRAYLAAAYQSAGRRGDSLRLYERMLAESERAHGPVHRDTMTARAQLAAAHQSVGQLREAITGYQRTLADRERVQGPDHPETLATRAALANAYRLAGKIKEAVGQYERVLADRERIQGADHPDTITARGNLAFAYRTAGKLKDAIARYERTLADRERVLGADHRDTLSTRANLAGAYQLARRLNDAIPQYERAVADSERVLGPGDIDTLTTRCNLATAYYAAGRPSDVVTVLRQALADCQQYLGPDHPMTSTVRENLQAATELRVLYGSRAFRLHHRRRRFSAASGAGAASAAPALFAAQDEDHAPGGGIVKRGHVVEVAVAGRQHQAARQPDGGGDLGGGPEPVGHHVADRARRAVSAVRGDGHVLPGYLAHRVDPVLAAAPAHLRAEAAAFDGPLTAGPRHRGEVVRRVRELGDVEPAGDQVGRHRGQVPHEVVEREQVAKRVQHGYGEVEGSFDAELPHVRFDHVEFQSGRLGLCRRVPAHRRGPVERGRAKSAPGEFQRMFGRAGGELENRPGAVAVVAGAATVPAALRVFAAPAQQGTDLGRDIPVGAGELVQLGFVVDSGHPSNDARKPLVQGQEAAGSGGRIRPG